METAPRFAVERTLGRLARLLRMLGFDTISECEHPRRDFAARVDSGRVFLARSRGGRGEPHVRRRLRIRSDRPADQVVEVLRALGIRPEAIRPFRLCLLCNEPIARVERREVAGLVPDYTWETNETFTRCPRCRRVYWRGSHTERALAEIRTWVRRATEEGGEGEPAGHASRPAGKDPTASA